MNVAIFDIAPWGQQTGDALIVGVTVDMLDAVSAHTGIRFTYHLIPYQRMFMELASGKIDASIFFRSRKSEAIAQPIAFVHEEKNIVIGLKGSDFNSYDDLRKVPIALPRGVYYHPRFDDDPHLVKHLTKGHDYSLRMLKAGRVGAVTGPRSALFYNAKVQGMRPDEFGLPYALSTNEAWLHVSRRSTKKHLNARLARAVRELQIKGVFQEILDQYFGNDGAAGAFAK